MKSVKLILFLVFFLGYSSLHAQKVKSNTVRFLLNNVPVEEAPDTLPPVITIIKPNISVGSILQTELEQIDLIGEVSDESKIRFVSINKEILVVNETGVFVTKLKLKAGENEIGIKAMDDNNNLQELNLLVEYDPPIVTLADRINKESKYYGLLIGIQDYQDRDLEDLENPIKDAEKLYQTLTDYYTFDPDNTRVIKNPSRTDIIRELDHLREKITPSDNLLIFYAGHGYYDEAAEVGYWLPSDATRETSADWFPNSTLVNHLKAIDSKHTLLITDACFAGSIFKSRAVSMEEVIYERIYELPSRKAITSGTFTEVPDESAFIKYLIQRLTENQETYLSSEELFSSMRMAVISNSNVLPRYGEIQNVGNEGGDFIFLRKKK